MQHQSSNYSVRNNNQRANSDVRPEMRGAAFDRHKGSEVAESGVGRLFERHQQQQRGVSREDAIAMRNSGLDVGLESPLSMVLTKEAFMMN